MVLAVSGRGDCHLRNHIRLAQRQCQSQQRRAWLSHHLWPTILCWTSNFIKTPLYSPPTEKAMAPHSSTLAWEILHGWRSLVGCRPWGLQESDTTEQLHFHALEKEMATHSSVLTWRIPGTGEPGGLPSMGSHRVGHNWSDLAAAAA